MNKINLEKLKIRTRYAPSPTGQLHIGGARTALFCYLFAKHFHGDFIIRIEDTDFERNIPGGEKSQLENLAWLNIIADESPSSPNLKYGPYRQSERIKLYKKYVKLLVEKGFAYPCFCTKQELETEKQRQLAINNNVSPKYNKKCRNLTIEQFQQKMSDNPNPVYRLKVPENKIYKWNDLIRSTIEFNSEEIEDFIIARADFIPTYNFAVVIDDYFMEISHVLRGEEHITNTSKQLVIYEMLGWKPPEFGHLTIITNEHKQKLSKRDLNTVQFIKDFKEQGFLPETIVNYLAQLGWTASNTNKEFFSLAELVELFDINNMSKSPSQFDIHKMEWMNGQYIKNMDDEKYFLYIKGFISQDILSSYSWEKITYLSKLFKKDLIKFNEINDKINSFYPKELIFEYRQILLKIFNEKLYINLKNLFDDLYIWSEQSITEAIKKFGSWNNLSGKNLYMPIRIICTLKDHGPEIAKCIYILGKDKVMENFKISESCWGN